MPDLRSESAPQRAKRELWGGGKWAVVRKHWPSALTAVVAWIWTAAWGLTRQVPAIEPGTAAPPPPAGFDLSLILIPGAAFILAMDVQFVVQVCLALRAQRDEARKDANDNERAASEAGELKIENARLRTLTSDNRTLALSALGRAPIVAVNGEQVSGAEWFWQARAHFSPYTSPLILYGKLIGIPDLNHKSTEVIASHTGRIHTVFHALKQLEAIGLVESENPFSTPQELHQSFCCSPLGREVINLIDQQRADAAVRVIQDDPPGSR